MTAISWTDEIWNPITGCSKVSEGCRNCYAERLAIRFQHSDPWLDQNAEQNVTLHSDRLDTPMFWKQSRRIFVCSMADLWHKYVPDDFINKVFCVMASTHQHIYLTLTKRPARASIWSDWPSNVWAGASVENRSAKERISFLRQTPATHRFISFEPLLENLGELDLSGIDWVIVGGESGPKFRPMKHEWAYDILLQCRAMGIPFFFKQSGSIVPETGKALTLSNGHSEIIQEYPLWGLVTQTSLFGD